MKRWNKIQEFSDFPSLNKKVLVVHHHDFYIRILEKDGQDGYCWKIENDEVIEWVDVFDIERWQDIS